jgi:hypothetical protein
MECLPGDVELASQCCFVFACSSPLADRGNLFRCQCAFAATVGSFALRHGYPFALALSDKVRNTQHNRGLRVPHRSWQGFVWQVVRICRQGEGGVSWAGSASSTDIPSARTTSLFAVLAQLFSM